jgi:hypothetical protein
MKWMRKVKEGGERSGRSGQGKLKSGGNEVGKECLSAGRVNEIGRGS